MKKLAFVMILLPFLGWLSALPPQVYNMSFEQRNDGSKIIDVYYAFVDPENNPCTITMTVSADDGETFPIIPNPAFLSGDIGSGIQPGPTKHIIWNAGAENYQLEGNLYRIKLLAEDGTQATVPIDFVEMPGRPYIMGRTLGEGDEDEFPPHWVTLSPYAIGRYEVTQSQWQEIMGSNPSHSYGVGPNNPVYNVSWYSILKYCNLRSQLEGLTPVYTIFGSTNPSAWGIVPTTSNTAWDNAICNLQANGYRLPTEAEWEYAARGGTNWPDFIYSGGNVLDTVAWWGGNATFYGTKPVGTKAPNHLGIYDMSGNLWEFCWDWFQPYTPEPQTNPLGAPTGIHRIARGGYWLNLPHQCEVHQRSGYWSYQPVMHMGFRLARTIVIPHT